MTQSQFKLGDVPDGQYTVIWSGNVVHFNIGDVNRSFTTVDRNGGMVSSCTIDFVYGIGTVKLKY